MHTSNSKTLKKRLTALTGSLAIAIALIGCGDHDHGHNGHSHDEHDHPHADHGAEAHDEHDDHAHEAEPVVITQYNQNSELFMEHPPLVQGEAVRLIVHLTRMADFSPITQGSLAARLIAASGEIYAMTAPQPARDGIFLPQITPPFAGTVTMELILRSPQMDTVHRIEGVAVYASANDVPHSHDEEDSSNSISFLKEQQWRIDFATVPATIGTVAPAIQAYGTLRLPPSGNAVIAAPASGIIGFADKSGAVQAGQTIEATAALFAITPDAGWGDGLANLREEFLLARLELERTQKLFKQEAIAERRVEEATIKLRTLADALERLGVDVESVNTSGMRAIARSPIGGVLAKIHVQPGQRVAAGDALAFVENPTRLVLEANVPVTRLDSFQRATDAIFHVDSRSQNYRISELGGSVVNASPLSGGQTGFARFLFQFDNPQPQLIAGQKVSVQVLGEGGKPGVIIPFDSVNEEQGQALVYVHSAGETVEKRYPRLGASNGRHIAVLAGIEAGERVVTRGANAIRLSSMSTTEMGHGHAH